MRTQADIALLRKSISDLENSKRDQVKLVASDLMFHRAIFQASGNRLTGRLFHTIHHAMLNMMMVTSQLVDLEHTVAFHVPILNAIEQRDAKLAAELMTAHLKDAATLVAVSRDAERSRVLRDHLTTSEGGLGEGLRSRTAKAKPRAARTLAAAG